VAALERLITRAERPELATLIGDLERLKALSLGRLVAATSPARAASDVAEDTYLTLAEVATRLRFSLPYCYELARRGDLPTLRRGKRGIRVRLADLRVWEQRISKDPLDGATGDVLASAPTRIAPGRQQRRAGLLRGR
jgi:excisionase family DNA binding protein